MKKIFVISFFFLLLLAAAGCGQKPLMDEVDKQGFYPYHNDFFNFDLPLPKEFIYYQTQRITADNYTDVDILVPTADTSIVQIIPNYAEPIIIRVFDKKYFGTLSAADKTGLIKVGEKSKKVFVMKFWDKIPTDWKDKWTEALKQQLVSNFKLK